LKISKIFKKKIHSANSYPGLWPNVDWHMHLFANTNIENAKLQNIRGRGMPPKMK
jgi:hypothetical protein